MGGVEISLLSQARSAQSRRLTVVLLLASAATAMPAHAQPTAEPPGAPGRNEIIVTCNPLALQGITPERSLDADQVDAYGLNTVGELYEQLLAESGETGDGPVVLVNGEPVPDLGDIADYPVEAVTRVDILPRGSAARVGGAPQRRIVSLTLRNRLQLLALTAGHRAATDGDWSAERGEAIFTHIRGPRRINLALRARDEDQLLESDRNLIQPQPARPFDIIGNVIADPRFAGSEIDPALSALAGTLVTRAAVPAGNANPTLQSFAANANQVNVTELGSFRTLLPDTRSYELSLTAADRLTPWLRGTLQARLAWNRADSLLGLPAGLFVLPVGSPFSPFTRDVGIAAYGATPLAQRSRNWLGFVTMGLTANLGRWELALTGNYTRSDSRFTTQRQDGQQTQPILLNPARNPYDGTLGTLLTILSDRSRSVLNVGNVQLRATGSPFAMPAGQVMLTLGAALNTNEVIASNSFTGRRRYSRSQRELFATGDIPLASRRNNVLPGLGELSAVFELGLTDISDFGTLSRYAYGINWAPRDWLRITAIENSARRPPDARVIGDAPVITSGVRYFDFLTGQTVDVTQLTGGNPLLLAERTTTRRLGLNAGPFLPVNLRLNAEYSSTVIRNAVASLPPASAAILSAFPDRFQRDLNGTLTLVDIRAVNFTRERLEQFRYGLNLAFPIGPALAQSRTQPEADEGGPPDDVSGEGAPGPVPAALRSRPRLQLAAFHTIILDNEVTIRPTLPRVDLLDGGATGIYGAPSRHQVTVLMTLDSRGMGVVVGGLWRSESFLITATGAGTDRLRFSPLATLNIRAFVAGRRLFPGERWLRGSRLSISVANLFNDRQEVRDSAGATPLRYQPGYRDPIGRTFEIEFRKTF